MLKRTSKKWLGSKLKSMVILLKYKDDIHETIILRYDMLMKWMLLIYQYSKGYQLIDIEGIYCLLFFLSSKWLSRKNRDMMIWVEYILYFVDSMVSLTIGGSKTT